MEAPKTQRAKSASAIPAKGVETSETSETSICIFFKVLKKRVLYIYTFSHFLFLLFPAFPIWPILFPMFPRFHQKSQSSMIKNTNFLALVEVKIRQAKMEDFNNRENSSGLSSGMRFYLGNPTDGWRIYRVNEATEKSKLQEHINRGLVWIPCSGFDSHTKLIKTIDHETKTT